MTRASVGVGVMALTTVGAFVGVRVGVGVAVDFVAFAVVVAVFVTAADAGAVLLAACGEGVGEDDKHPAVDTTTITAVQIAITAILNRLSSFIRLAFDNGYDT